jgi:hypothetical protein
MALCTIGLEEEFIEGRLYHCENAEKHENMQSCAYNYGFLSDDVYFLLHILIELIERYHMTCISYLLHK